MENQAQKPKICALLAGPLSLTRLGVPEQHGTIRVPGTLTSCRAACTLSSPLAVTAMRDSKITACASSPQQAFPTGSWWTALPPQVHHLGQRCHPRTPAAARPPGTVISRSQSLQSTWHALLDEHAGHDARRQPDAVLHRPLRAPSPPAPDTFLRSFHQQIAAHCMQRTRAMVRRWRRRCWSCSLAAAQAEHQGEARRRRQGRHGVPGGLPGTTDPPPPDRDAADVGKLRARLES